MRPCDQANSTSPASHALSLGRYRIDHKRLDDCWSRTLSNVNFHRRRRQSAPARPSVRRAPTLEAALAALAAGGIGVRRRSRWYRTAPVPASDQPGTSTASSRFETALPPDALLAVLHRDRGRRSGGSAPCANAPACSISICWPFAASDRGRRGPGSPILPHPRMHDARLRAACRWPTWRPAWRHPVLGHTDRGAAGGPAGRAIVAAIEPPGGNRRPALRCRHRAPYAN